MKYIFIVIIIISISIFQSTVEAADNSLFKIEHMAPGDTISKEITVYNDAKVKRAVGIRGVRKIETGHLSQVLSIEIADNTHQLYGGRNSMKTMAQFFSESIGSGGVFLSTIPARTKRNFGITVRFLPGAGNEFQSKRLLFDIKIEPSINKRIYKNKNFDKLYHYE